MNSNLGPSLTVSEIRQLSVKNAHLLPHFCLQQIWKCFFTLDRWNFAFAEPLSGKTQ